LLAVRKSGQAGIFYHVGEFPYHRVPDVHNKFWPVTIYFMNFCMIKIHAP